MNKIKISAAILLLTLSFSSFVYADPKTEQKAVESAKPAGIAGSFKVIGRGLATAVSTPLDIVYVFGREWRHRRKVMVFTYLPQLVMTAGTRLISAAEDVFFYPFVAPFEEECPSLLSRMGLPEYPWTGAEDDF